MTTIIKVMNAELEKILSTMGIHELSGYGRIFSSIGLPQAVAQLLGIPSFASPEYRTWADSREKKMRQRSALIGEAARITMIRRATPYIHKLAGKLASGSIPGLVFHHESRALEEKHVIALSELQAIQRRRSQNTT